MLSYCLKFRRNTKSKSCADKKRKNNTFKMFDSKKSKIIKVEEACGLLSSLGIKTLLNKILY